MTPLYLPSGMAVSPPVTHELSELVAPPAAESPDWQRISRYGVLPLLFVILVTILMDQYFRPLSASSPVAASLVHAPARVPQPFTSYFSLISDFPVQETDEALVVKPVVTQDPRGGLLVADSRESQVRFVSDDGDLVDYFGRPGDGPREFRSLSSVVRLNSGELLTTEISGRITLTDADGDRVIRSLQVAIEPLYAATVLDDSTVILTGRHDGKLVHLWDTRTREVRQSFYPVPEHPAEMASAYEFTGFPAVAVRGETIVVLFALSDELRFFDGNGAELDRRLRIPYQRFRPLREPQPAHASPEEFRRWTESFSVASRIYWLHDGSFVIQYFDRAGSEQSWSTLHVAAGGEWLFEDASPKLLTVLRRGSEAQLLFAAADYQEPAQWQLRGFR